MAERAMPDPISNEDLAEGWRLEAEATAHPSDPSCYGPWNDWKFANALPLMVRLVLADSALPDLADSTPAPMIPDFGYAVDPTTTRQYLALAAERDRLAAENAELRAQVRQMGLHSLGCSGKVGTDGVECEWPGEGPCLVADLRAQMDDWRVALAQIADYGGGDGGDWVACCNIADGALARWPEQENPDG